MSEKPGRKLGKGKIGKDNAGERPLSPRQRARLQVEQEMQARQVEAARYPRSPDAPPLPSLPPTPPASGIATGRTRRHVKDAETTRRRASRTEQRERAERKVETGEEVRPRLAKSAPRNRRRVNVVPILLRVSCAVLAVECVAALLFSPRLNVTRVSVTGNQTVPKERLLQRVGKVTGNNIVRLPVWQMRRALLAEPTVEFAEVHRTLPGQVTLKVTERKPWASVRIPDGKCYTIDSKHIAFRVSDDFEAGVPRLRLAPANTANGSAPPVAPVTLGKPMNAPGLTEVSRCLAWADTRPDFPLEAVTIDSEGKLCLNRTGGVEVRLGVGTADLDKKLASLELLLERKPQLRDGVEVAYVNLYAYDAPAIKPKEVSKPNPHAPTQGAKPASVEVEPTRARTGTATSPRL